MKVLFINRYFYPDHSATSQLLSDLAFFLASEGRQVHVITSRQRYDEPGASLTPREVTRGVTVHRIWTSRFGRGNLAGRVLDYLTFYLVAGCKLLGLAARGDIVVTKTDPPLLSLVTFPAARIKGAALVNWLQDIFPEVAGAAGFQWASSAFGRCLEMLRDWTLRAAQMNVVLGTAMEQYLLSRGVSADRVRVIPNWADGEKIQPVAKQGNILRALWNLDGKFVVGYSGNMGRVHEFETILQAAAHLKEQPDIVFLFIGGGAQRDWIESRTRELGIGNVQFRPYQPRDELGSSLSVPDVHLVSLLPGVEGFVFPSKIYGALAAGRPIVFVGRQDGEISRLVREEGIGFSVPCENGTSLAAVIQSLATNFLRTAEMGASARKLFDQRYSSTIAFRKWSELLDSAMR